MTPAKSIILSVTSITHARAQLCYFSSISVSPAHCYAGADSLLATTSSGAARGEIPPYGLTSKNYVICVCFHCHGTSSYYTYDKYIARPSSKESHVDTQTIQPGLGDFVL